MEIDMKKKFLSIYAIALMLCTLTLNSCNSISSQNTPPESSNEATQAQSGFVHDTAKYPLSESLDSEASVSEVGLSVGGVTVEGKKYIHASYECTGFDSEKNEYIYTTVGESLEPDLDKLTELPEGCPVIKYADDIKVIASLETTEISCYYRAMEEAEDGAVYSGSEPPTAPGMYWLLVDAEVPSPLFDQSITPEVGQTYYAGYRYLFAVVVE